jgi:hypothetical protein
MRRTVIALQGVQRLGKTATIRLTYRRLLRRQGVREVQEPCTRCSREIRDAIVEIAGVRVGFLSKSENRRFMEYHINYLIREGCQVIVCATHVRCDCASVQIVEGLENDGWDLVRIPKERGFSREEQDLINSNQADEIIRRIYAAIGGSEPSELIVHLNYHV